MRRFLVAAVAAFVPAAGVRAADKPIELSHMPAAVPIAITVDAVKLKKNLIDLGVPVEKQFEKAPADKKALIEHITRGTVLLDLFPAAAMPVGPAAILTTKDATAKADLEAVLEGKTEATVGGKAVLRGKDKTMAGLALDDKTLLIGVDPTLEKLFADGAKGGDLAKEYEQADRKHDVVAVVAMKPLLAKLKEQFGDLDKVVPPAAEQFWTAGKRLEAVTFAVDLADDTLLKGTFRADNAEGADMVKDALAGGVALLSLGLPQAEQGLSRGLPEEARKPAVAVLKAIAKSTKFKVDGSTVVMTVARPKDFGK